MVMGAFLVVVSAVTPAGGRTAGRSDATEAPTSAAFTAEIVHWTFIGTVTALSSPQIHLEMRRNFVPLIGSLSSGPHPIERPRTSIGTAVKALHASSTRVLRRLGSVTREIRALM